MDSRLYDLISAKRSSGVLVDTNLLLLDVVGSLEPDLIHRFKRTHTYSAEEYFLLQRFSGLFSLRLTTAHILAEVSNLLGQLPTRSIAEAYGALQRRYGTYSEPSLSTSQCLSDPLFQRLGLTDAGIATLASTHSPLVLTDDFPLALALEKRSVAVLNFNHIRDWSP